MEPLGKGRVSPVLDGTSTGAELVEHGRNLRMELRARKPQRTVEPDGAHLAEPACEAVHERAGPTVSFRVDVAHVEPLTIDVETWLPFDPQAQEITAIDSRHTTTSRRVLSRGICVTEILLSL
jgi:hypothetical protein